MSLYSIVHSKLRYVCHWIRFYITLMLFCTILYIVQIDGIKF